MKLSLYPRIFERIMFFFLSKFLHFAINPLFWVMFFLILAILRLKNPGPNPLSGWKRIIISVYYHRARAHVIRAFFILFIFGNTVLTNELLIWWEIPISTNKIHLDSNFPKTAVVLGGFGTYHVHSDWYRLNDAPERLLSGMEGLVHQRFDRVLLSGGNSNIFDKRFFDAQLAKNYLCRFKIDTSKVIADNRSRNTCENALYTKQILDSLSIQEPVLLITSAAHMRRSIACFDKYQVKIVPYPVQHIGNLERNYSVASYIIPNVLAMEKMQNLLHEWVGFIAYKLSGKID